MARTQHATATSPPLESGTVIGPDIRVSGRVSGEEDLHVEGRVDGAIVLTETLFVAPGGVVAAQVEAHNIVVSGVVLGNVTARDCVTLHPGAKLVGDIAAPRLVIADGATFKGNVRMGGEAPPARDHARPAARSRAMPATRRPAAPPRASASDRRPPMREPARASEPPAREPIVDDEPTVIVRHAAISEDESARVSRARDESAAIARGAKAPPVGARPEGKAPVPPKKKLPARARIPKPGKRRVNRR